MQTFSKNKLKTAGYFIKRLRDNGFVVLKMFAFYAQADPRRWTILINPGGQSVFITCYVTSDGTGEYLFEISDGGQRIPKNYHLKTDSIQVVIGFLLNHGVSNDGTYPGKSKFMALPLNTYNEQETQTAARLEGSNHTGGDKADRKADQAIERIKHTCSTQ